MAEHADLAGYILGALEPDEAAAFEEHLHRCPVCRAEHGEIGMLPAAPAAAFAVPSGLRGRTLAGLGAPARRRRGRPWRVLVPAVGAAVAAAAIAVVIAGRGNAVERYALRGGSAQVSATVQTTGVGREVTITIGRLHDPRPDGLYELWFVAPDDSRSRPHRVSAGTFHPDDAGRGSVRLVAAADPQTYTSISVTLEPADGNPRRQGPTVLRAVASRPLN
jgi:Anti-sigma-K factor rskA/Putative zinc-finger